MTMIAPAQDNRVRTMAARINRSSNSEKIREASWDVIHVIDKAIDRVMKSSGYNGTVAEIKHVWDFPKGLDDDAKNAAVTDVANYLNANGYYCGVIAHLEDKDKAELHVSWA